MGARHFAAKANLLQNLTQLAGSAIGQDPSVNVHMSGKKIAQVIEEVLDLEKYGIYKENVRIFEQQETQQLINSAQQQVDEQQALSNEMSGVPNAPQPTDPMAGPPTGP